MSMSKYGDTVQFDRLAVHAMTIRPIDHTLTALHEQALLNDTRDANTYLQHLTSSCIVRGAYVD